MESLYHSGIQSPHKCTGFTLIEMISVLVILGIVLAIGTSFLVSAINIYDKEQQRSKLQARARVVVEQMTRQLRLSVPNSLRVSVSGACIEFLPISAGTNYLEELPDGENGASADNSIGTAPFDLVWGSAIYAVVAPLSASEVYQSSSPRVRARVATIGALPSSNITLTSAHIFLRNSINKRIFLADNPIRFCVTGGNLREYRDYTFSTSALTDIGPGGTSVLLAQNISSVGTVFSLSPGSQDRNASVDIVLGFNSKTEQLIMQHTVLIQNVP